MNRSFKDVCIKNFFDSFTMLAAIPDLCPGELWHKKMGGFIFWQQLLHCLDGIHYWMRWEGQDYVSPFSSKRVFPNLEKEAVDQLSKKDIKDYCLKLWKQCDDYFKNLSDTNLLANAFVDNNKSHLDALLLQIRHIQYHTGHCNSILREQDMEAVAWVE